MKLDSEKIKESVRKSYTGVAKNVNISSCCKPAESSSSCGSDASSSCCGSDETVVTTLKKLGYELEELKNIPEESILGAGCGNPTAMAGLKPREVVLDLGSGAGIDCFLAANKVGDDGYVIGVDFTPAMLARARSNAVKGGYENVEFRKGDIENLPVVSNSVDVIISNCVINLAPDKEKVFSEAFRVLKPGGRIHVSDIVWLKDLPKSIRESEEALAGCVGGAVRKEEYINAIEKAGFKDITIEKEIKVPVVINEKAFEKTGEKTIAVITGGEAIDLEDSIASIDVSAFKSK